MALTVGDASSSRIGSVDNPPAAADAGDKAKDANATPAATPAAKAAEEVVRATRTMHQYNMGNLRLGAVPGEEGAQKPTKPIQLAGRCAHGGWCGG
jgi:hypothetical protein